MQAEQDSAAGEQQGDSGGTEDLEFAEAVGVGVGGRAAGELPADEGDEVANKV